MLRMAVGHSDDVDAADAIAIAVDQCRAQLDGLGRIDLKGKGSTETFFLLDRRATG